MESQRKLKHTHNTLFTNCPSNRQAQTDIFCCAPTRTKNGRHQDIFSFFFCVFEWKRERIVSFKKITRDSRRKRTKKWTVCYSLRGCPPTTWPRKLKRNFALLLFEYYGINVFHFNPHFHTLASQLTFFSLGRWLLVERLLPTPEIRGSNPVIGQLLNRTFVYCQLYWTDENKEKEAENGPFK